jgi:hypothetical protein
MSRRQDKVFLDYTQEQLDQAYDQLVWAPHRDAIQAEIRKDCEAVRRKMPPRTERYGKSEMQVLDIFAPAGTVGVPVVVYLHGGAWLRGSRLDVAYPAPAVTGRGAALVVTDFNNVSEVSLPAMIEQCREAVDWTVRNAASFGGDPDRVYLAGHSSGAHLASCVLLGNTGAQRRAGDQRHVRPARALAFGAQQVREHHAGGTGCRQRHAPSRPRDLSGRRRLVGRRQPGIPPPGAGLRRRAARHGPARKPYRGLLAEPFRGAAPARRSRQ